MLLASDRRHHGPWGRNRDREPSSARRGTP